MSRPYGSTFNYIYNPMDVIGHDDKYVNIDIWEMFWDINPGLFNNLTDLVQYNLTIDYFTKEILSLMADNRHEIGPWLGIIVFLQSNGLALVLLILHFLMCVS